MRKYSLIIPCYNSSKTIFKLLKSIENSKKIEIIIVDDKSKIEEVKKIKEKLKKYSNIKFIENKTEKKGAGVSRNIGILNSNSEWLLFADTDDYFLENFLENIEKATEKYSDSDIIFFPPTSYDIEKNKPSNRNLKLVSLVENFRKNPSLKNEMKLRYCSNTPWSKLIKRKLVEENNIQFDETIIANDSIFSLKIGKKAKQVNIFNKQIYCVTKNLKSLTGKKDQEKYKIRLKVFKRYYEMLSDKEKKIVGVSPLPLLYNSRIYGFKFFLETIIFFKKNNIKFLKYFQLEIYKLRILLKI